MPAGQTEVPVELDEVFNMFDAPTRRASQGNLKGFGDALAGRGADLNQTIQVAPELFDHLRSVMANLSDRRTHLRSFFKELDDAARIVAPVSQSTRTCSPTMADTFERPVARPAGAEGHDLKVPADAAGRHRVAARAAPVPRAHRRAVARPRRRRHRAARRAADSTPRCASARRSAPLDRAQRQPPGRARRARGPRQGADNRRLAARPDGDRRHAAAAAALPRPVRDGL